MKLCSPVAVGILLLLVKPQGIAAPSPAGGPSHALPAALSLERYRPMMERSPFAVASEAAPAQPVAAAGFAKDLVLTGAVRLGDSEFVTISSRDQTQRFGLKTGETYNGISVVSVAWSDTVGKTKATLKSGSEFGVIGFDEALMRNNAAPTPELTPFANNAQPMPPGIIPNPAPPNTPGFVGNPPGNPANSNNTSHPPALAPMRHRMIRSAPAP